MSNPRTPSVQTDDMSGQTPSIARRLAAEMLEGLRSRAFSKLTKDAETEEEAPDLEATANLRLPVDTAAYAIGMAYALAPHFRTVAALVKTKALIVIKGRAGDDADAVGAVLTAILSGGERVVCNPNYGLASSDRIMVIANASVRHTTSAARAIAQATQRCLPIFCTLDAQDAVPDILSGADLHLDMPVMTPEMLAVLFEVTHDEVPADVLRFASADKLRSDILVAHIRRGRPAAVCLSGLQQAVEPPKAEPRTGIVRLGDLAGYGQAKTWGLELAQDLKLWREGRLGWDEVDHRAVILAGAPGTGKTSFATVLAATLQVPLIATSVAEWNARDHLSGALKRMQTVFEQAIAEAPCVLFIDEIDGISSRNGIEGRHAEYWTQIVNRMLELVTNALSTEGVVIVGATNHVDRIDPALTRSGRLDEIIRIALPDAEAIAHILAHYANSMCPPMSCPGLPCVSLGCLGRISKSWFERPRPQRAGQGGCLASMICTLRFRSRKRA